MFARLFRRRSFSDEAVSLYEAAVRQGRLPVFYERLAVPDTVDGRFDLIALHVYLLFRRLKGEGPAAESLAQDLAEVFFADMDLSLREMGAADIGVGRRVKRMIEGFYGRATAYDKAQTAGGEALVAALARNLYGTVSSPPAACLAAMARYLGDCEAELARLPRAKLLAGEARFAPPPVPEAEETP